MIEPWIGIKTLKNKKKYMDGFWAIMGIIDVWIEKWYWWVINDTIKVKINK